MSSIVRTDKSATEATLTVTIHASDYASKIKQEVKQYAQKAQMKGFRPGKTPTSVVNKMYGTAFIVDIVNKEVGQLLDDYLKNEALALLGEPIISETKSDNVFSSTNPQDLVFHFDIGFQPTIQVKGLDKNTHFERLVIEVPAEKIAEEWQKLIERSSAREEVSTPIVDNDYVTLEAKQGALEKTVSVLTSSISDIAKAILLGKNLGDSFTFNVYALENDATEEFVTKHILKLEEGEAIEGGLMDFKISKIERIVPTELNDDFFEHTFGPNVKTEEAAKAFISDYLGGEAKSQAEALLYREIQERMVELNEIPLPDDFMKRWLHQNNPKVSAADLESEYPHFAKNLAWSLLRGQIMKDANLRITEEDLREFYKSRIRGYLGGMANEQLENSLADRVISDEKQVNELYEEYATKIVFEYLADQVQVTNRTVSEETFKETIAKLNAQIAAERNSEQSPVLEAEAVEVE